MSRISHSKKTRMKIRILTAAGQGRGAVRRARGPVLPWGSRALLLAALPAILGSSIAAEDFGQGIPDDTPWNRTGVNDAVTRALAILGTPQAEWPQRHAGAGSPDARLATQYQSQLATGGANLQLAAVEALGKAGSVEEAGQLIRALESPDIPLRDAAMQALQKTPVGILAPALLAAFVAPEPISPQLAGALSPVRSAALEDRLLETLGRVADPLTERAAAARALGVLQSKRAIPALQRAFDSGSGDLPQAALDALFVLRATETLPVWLTLLRHPDEQVGATAVRALGDLGGAEAAEALYTVAISPDAAPSMRSAAVLAIAQWPYLEAVPALVNVLAAAPDLRGPVSRVLRDLTGADLGGDPATWQAWMAGGPDGAPPAPSGEVEPSAVDPSQDALPFQVQFVP